MHQKNEAKAILDQGGFILVEVHEKPHSTPSVSLSAMTADHVKEIHPMHRVFIVASTLCWLNIQNDSAPDAEELAFSPDMNAMGITQEELISYVAKTVKHYESAWPAEFKFAQSCVYDSETAWMLMTPTPLQPGLKQKGPLIPLGFAGLVYRVTSPVAYFQTEAPEPEPIMIMTPQGISTIYRYQDEATNEIDFE